MELIELWKKQGCSPWRKSGAADPEQPLQQLVHRGIRPSYPENAAFSCQPCAPNSQAMQASARPAALGKVLSGSQVMSDISNHHLCCLACFLQRSKVTVVVTCLRPLYTASLQNAKLSLDRATPYQPPRWQMSSLRRAHGIPTAIA